MALMQETRSRLDDIERRKLSRSYAPTESHVDVGALRPSRSRRGVGDSVANDIENTSPITVTLPMHTPGRSGTVIEESLLVPGETEFTQAESEHGQTMASEHHHDGSHHDLEGIEEGEGGEEGEEGEEETRETEGEYLPEEFDPNAMARKLYISSALIYQISFCF